MKSISVRSLLLLLCAGRLLCMSMRRRFVSKTSLFTTSPSQRDFSNLSSLDWADPFLFSRLLQLCIPKRSVFLGKQLHSLVITSGALREKFVCNHLLNMYSKIGDSRSALALFYSMPNKNLMSCNILINGYVQAGDLEAARKLFDEMPQRNLATWNAMIAGMTQFERNEEGLNLFNKMYESGFLPDEFTLGSVLRGCAGLKTLSKGTQVHSYVIKCGFEVHSVVSNSLAHMYMKGGSLGEGEKAIKSLPTRNIVAWNTLLAGKAQNGCFEEVLQLYNSMRMTGFRPDKITFVSVLTSCAELATITQGQQIHAQVIKGGSNSVVAIVSSLISMYSRCGCFEDSLKVFTECEDADAVIWSSMISAYGFHGRGEEAIELFHQMEEKELEPCDVTFLSLLHACSHCGLKEKGYEIFNLMVEKYELKPRLEHYTCLVDLLGRSGSLDEAEAKIQSMPVKADTVIWKTLLFACRVHKNEEMAKRVAKEILKLDPGDSTAYVMLANVHASAKSWDDASDVWKTMRERKVKKETGVSWLQIGNQIHRFCTADKSHPKLEAIDSFLKELMAEMKLHGYAPSVALF